jgi:hypothetical protein
MNLEKQNQIKDLLKVCYSNEKEIVLDARFFGMCQAMLTDEQADTMISYIQKWIEEK